MYQTKKNLVKDLKKEENAKVLTNIAALSSNAAATDIVTAFNSLIADLKAKGLMKEK